MVVVASRKGREKNRTLKGYKEAFTRSERSTLFFNQKQMHTPASPPTTIKTPTKFPAPVLSQAIFGCA